MIIRLQYVFLCVLLFSYKILSRPLLYQRPRRQLTTEEGLYGPDSKLTLLNSTTVNMIYGTENAWLVEFYANWCGHCQRFAPVYDAVGDDVAGWKAVVRAAALDCAASINGPLCREMAISHYPTLRFFSAHAHQASHGLDVPKRNNSEDIRRSLVEILVKEQQEGRGTTWPEIKAHKFSNIQDLWSDVPSSVKYLVVTYEDDKSVIGAEIILDLLHSRSVAAKRVSNNDTDTALIAIEDQSVPNIAVLGRDNSVKKLEIEATSRKAIFSSLKSYMSRKGINLNQGAEDGKSDSVDDTTLKSTPKDTTDKTQYRSDKLYQVDLENAIRYSFKREVAVQNVIEGESLSAFKNYLKILAKYFPINKKGVRFFEYLRDWVSGQESLTGKDFLERVESLEDEMRPVFNSKEEWLGCKGSNIKYRGYPCGLWTLFHTLTTNAVLQNGKSGRFDSLEVLDAMEGYVRHFFGCQECSQHFQEMSTTSMRGNVTNPDDSIMWLWRAHNSVNKRLSGDITEDPKHPKIQFPSRESCPTCRNFRGSWVETEVLAFLKHMYGRENIDYTRWSGTLEHELPPNTEGQNAGDEISSSGSWSNLGVPLFLITLAALGLLVFYTSSKV